MVWTSDITYLDTGQGWLYLCAVRDGCSRRVIGYAFSDSLRTDVVETALRPAVTFRDADTTGAIFHADRGCQGGFKRSSQHLDRGRANDAASSAPSPSSAAEHGHALAELHHGLDHIPQPPDAPPGCLLIHGDLHPDNVLLGPSSPVLIDWSNAHIGRRATDVAITWLILACLTHPDPLTSRDLERVRPALLQAFLHVDAKAAATELPATAQNRLLDLATTPAEATHITTFLQTST